MSATTSIEWTRGDDGTAGRTWNPLRGCSRVSPGPAEWPEDLRVQEFPR